MKYIRKTVDEWEIQGYYNTVYGWERVTTEISRKEAREQLKCYNENEKNVPHRIVKKRVKIEGR